MHLGGVLYVYKGEWGLPSIDFDCLRALCLVKFTRCPLQIDTNANPMRSSTGKLPYLQIGNKRFCGYRQIKKVLDKEGYPVDAHLQEEQKLLSPAYANWVFTNLHSYYHYFMYGEPNNFDTTRSLYAKRTTFPFNFFYPSSYQREACDIVMVMGGFDPRDKLENHDRDYLTTNAKKCVNLLSKKLGRKVWFFGDFFSEFDAIVYSYLAILFKVTLPNNPLQNHIKGCQNLVNFINRITKDIFRNEGFNSLKTLRSQSSNDPLLTATERHFLESEKKTKILAAIGAVVAMGTFAAWRGVYKQFSSSRRYYNDLVYEDDEALEDDEMD
ncbi:metaxin-1 homolog [Rhagoletis pomonella]|uniref:metaxin-1 homolog n=2 Tax=Rhagoletis pomonella TaxID=28610 RepID=UPI001780297E|nr:metaxin-1 homolog isoform X1 [Rhagoletis pomonella]XP_036341877.1 metaxin-1 homolog [Rhagoletis pomonella]